MIMQLTEFSLIDKYFKRKPVREDVLLGVGDDCAVVKPPPGSCLLVTTDTLNASRHFFPDTQPFDIGYKALAVSLSDLAAMGGEPSWVLLSLTLPEAEPEWLQAFSDGFFSCLESTSAELIGGNITKGPLTISTEVIGFASQNQYLTRSGASPGDLIYVTGSLGSSAVGLGILSQTLELEFTPEEIEAVTKRLWQPPSRIAIGKALVTLASSAIDISDGLAADLGHILAASEVGASLEVEKIPAAPVVTRLPQALREQYLLFTGDDYELCFTIPSVNAGDAQQLAHSLNCPLTCVGVVEETPGLRLVQPGGRLTNIAAKGYEHF